MRPYAGALRTLALLLLSSTLPAVVLAGDILSTNGYSTCVDDPTIDVQRMNVQYDRRNQQLSFDVAGTSKEVQNVTLVLTVTAYGAQVYEKEFNPCDTGMTEMCPVPAGSFASTGEQTIPSEFANQIPSIAFSVPDLDGNVKLVVKNADGGDAACISSSVGNGMTLQHPAIAWVAGGIVAAAFLLSACTSLASGGAPGASTPSPTFGEVLGWFQGMAMNGMMSVKYPSSYQSFASNFGFSTGLIPWAQMQIAIDDFRKSTGGNLTDNNYKYLQNATLVYPDGSSSNASSGLSLGRRWLDHVVLYAREGATVDINGTSTTVGNSTSNSTSSAGGKEQHTVQNLQAYVEQLSIPDGNTFMTVLLSFAIVIAAMVVLILLGKVILEFWAMFGKLPKSMESWRRRYWWRMAKAIVNLILLLYGVWTLYCVYQFTNGDSWAAKVLAGVTFAVFTVVLAFFTWRIWFMARKAKKAAGDPASKLYEDKETWIRYSLFYDNYKKSYWWVFVPVIIYMFAKGCIIAGANGHGLVQSGGQLIVEAIMLAFLVWYRPFTRKSGNWFNIIIQVVRVLSVACILVFVEELGISQTTKTVTGMALIVVQCVLTGVLAILIAVNALIFMIRENPHRRRRKEAEKLNRDIDNLTPLDPHNSLLMGPMAQHDTAYKRPIVTTAAPAYTRDYKGGKYGPITSERAVSPDHDDEDRLSRFHRNDSSRNLVSEAASFGHGHARDESMSPAASRSPPRSREPRLPQLDLGRAF